MSVFDLTPPANDPAPTDLFEDLLLDLSEPELNILHAAACPLFDALLDTINAYAATQDDLSFMTVLYALDMLLSCTKQTFADELADA